MCSIFAAIIRPAFSQMEINEEIRIAEDGDMRSLLLALDRTAQYLENHATGAPNILGMPVDRMKMLATVQKLRSILLRYKNPTLLSEALSAGFEFYRAPSGTLVTGYYNPVLIASRQKTERFIYPIYGRPFDLQCQGDKCWRILPDGSKAPYYTRKEIDNDGVLNGKNLEIAWVDDPIERYWMQVQGSCILKFTDGSVATLKFAGHNGYPYRSIAQDLIDQKKVKGDFLGIKNWLRNRPQEALQYFTGNKRYIFFALSSGPPTGVEGIPLSPARTLAADLSQFPAGTIIYLQCQIPVVDDSGNVKAFQKINRIMTIADTGDAIRGPNHVDYYVGEGIQAEYIASRLKTQGNMHVILLREP